MSEQQLKLEAERVIKQLTALGCLADYVGEILWVVYPKRVKQLVEDIQKDHPALTFQLTIQKNHGLGVPDTEEEEKGADTEAKPSVSPTLPATNSSPPVKLPHLPRSINVRGDLGDKDHD